MDYKSVKLQQITPPSIIGRADPFSDRNSSTAKQLVYR